MHTMQTMQTMQTIHTTTNNVYQATMVDTTVDGKQKVETYVRVSAPPWKSRYSGHKSSFTNPNKKGETKLSTKHLGAQGQGLHLRREMEGDRQGGPLHSGDRKVQSVHKREVLHSQKTRDGFSQLEAGGRQPLSSHRHVSPLKCWESESARIAQLSVCLILSFCVHLPFVS